MIRIPFFCLLFALAFVNPALAEPQVIIIDHQYDSELVKMACIPKMEPACVDAKVRELTAFEDAIRTNLTSDPKCRGVTIAPTGDHPGPYWDLLIDSNSKSFRLMRLHEASNFTNYTETGTPPDIAQKICVMINKKAGS